MAYKQKFTEAKLTQGKNFILRADVIKEFDKFLSDKDDERYENLLKSKKNKSLFGSKANLNSMLVSYYKYNNTIVKIYYSATYIFSIGFTDSRKFDKNIYHVYDTFNTKDGEQVLESLIKYTTESIEG